MAASQMSPRSYTRKERKRKSYSVQFFLHTNFPKELNFIFDWIMFNAILFISVNVVKNLIVYTNSSKLIWDIELQLRTKPEPPHYVRVPCTSSNRIHSITYEKDKRTTITWSDHKVAQSRYSVVASFSIYLYVSSRMWDEWIKIFVLRVCLCACLKVFCSGWIFLRFSFFSERSPFSSILQQQQREHPQHKWIDTFTFVKYGKCRRSF